MKHIQIFCVLATMFFIVGCSSSSEQKIAKSSVEQNAIFPKVNEYLKAAKADITTIEPTRKKELDEMANHIANNQDSGQVSRLVFICTHNSRRSHMSQIWAATAAGYLGLKNIKTYSGGTEATAFNPRAVAALRRAGFIINNPEGTSDNPYYKVSFSSNGEETMGCFSKKFTHRSNPQKDFIAIMTCSQAAESCPRVEGAEAYFLLPYQDPKSSDNTPQETKAYDERCCHIATEMLYLMTKVNELIA